jgi:malto-oligosyltrehalose trehalohydrolase
VTTFRVWAPNASVAQVATRGMLVAMEPAADGWWRADVAARSDAEYQFRLDGGDLLADPRSPRQPLGPDGPSQNYDHAAFAWADGDWPGRPLRGQVIYELHIGTFTAEGTFDAAIGKLDCLVWLGVTAVELMPVASFPGRNGWGYDAISLWAVHEPYGGPDGLKRLVAACHARQLAVILDVVFNHVGIGNRLADFGPYFTGEHNTPWGPAVNLDQPGSAQVRAFVIENALMWLRDYHVDGLRLDAVHALVDSSQPHLLAEMSAAVASLEGNLGRALILIAESDQNDPRLVTPTATGGYGLGAVWSDDFHHAVHALLTGERQGYYADFGSVGALAKTLTRVFFHDGTWSSFRGRNQGRPVDTSQTPAEAFVVFGQNHDQVGNRAAGDRLSATLSPDLLRVAAGLVLTAPFTPMLFMGEEWGASEPWQYFTHHTHPGLGRAVAEGRRAEFARHGWDPLTVPDPQDPETFLRSKLDWSQVCAPGHRDLLTWYRELIALRNARAELTDPRLDQVRVDYDEPARWIMIERGRLLVAANLGPSSVRLPAGAARVSSVVLAASKDGVSAKDGQVELPPAALAVIET